MQIRVLQYCFAREKRNYFCKPKTKRPIENERLCRNDYVPLLICFSIYADTPGIKNFTKIALSHTVSKINAFLCFTKKFKIAAANGGKTILGKVTR